MAPAPQPAYAKDEKALCFHHELLYEAKVLDYKPVDPNDKKSPFQYKVHYKGWKNTWDDWVPQDRLRKFTEENKELAANLKKEMETLNRAHTQKSTAQKKKKTTGSDPAAGSTRGSEERHSSVAAAGGPRGQKRARETEIEKEESFLSRPSVRILIPDRLKSMLVDDWENVTKNLQLVQLPSKTPASLILDEYAAYEGGKRRPGSAEADILEEVIQGIKEYFNKSLGRILLYRFERQQFYEIFAQLESSTSELAGKAISDVYGGEHLLRLFVSMPELIAQTNMDHQSVSRLREELTKITLWLARDVQVQRYFSVEYENASQEYVEKAKGVE